MNILFICTHNRCRCILSEAMTNQLGHGKLVARSAGSQPSGEVHPKSLQFLQEAGISTEGLHSKSWDDLTDFAPDLVVTLCDSAASEACPLWLGNAERFHWGLADPSKIVGTEEDIAAAFRATLATIRDRTQQLLALVDAGLSANAIKHHLAR
jgi:arsenate reductase